MYCTLAWQDDNGVVASKIVESNNNEVSDHDHHTIASYCIVQNSCGGTLVNLANEINILSNHTPLFLVKFSTAG